MEITIKINTESESDKKAIDRFLNLFNADEQVQPEEKKTKKATTRKKTKEAENEQTAPNEMEQHSAETASVEQTDTKEVQLQEELNATTEEETAGVATDSSEKDEAETFAPSELPKADRPKTCSLPEWRKAFEDKKNALKLNEGQENEGIRPMFLDFVHRLSASYGDRIPSKLTDEKRGEFMIEFESIQFNKAEGFHTTALPF